MIFDSLHDKLLWYEDDLQLGKVFKDGGEIDGSSGADTLGVLAGLEETGDTADGELETGLAATRLSLLSSSGT
nr:hypothetical protein Ahy_B03g066517 [Ipomoea trifida]